MRFQCGQVRPFCPSIIMDSATTCLNSFLLLSSYYGACALPVKLPRCLRQGFSNVFFLFPSPPQKRVKERVANWVLPRPTGNAPLITLAWGFPPIHHDLSEPLLPP